MEYGVWSMEYGSMNMNRDREEDSVIPPALSQFCVAIPSCMDDGLDYGEIAKMCWKAD